MIDFTQVLVGSGLVFLIGFIVLALPLMFLASGWLLPLYELLFTEVATDAVPLVVRSAPVARRSAAPRRSVSRKLAVSPRPARKVAAKKKAAPKKKVAAKRKVAPKKKSAAVPTGARLDPEMGVVFTKRPKVVDDLKKISGVGKVLEGKLHTAGIYTYRQIAGWKVAQIAAFDGLLSFKGRIQRDGWKRQAAALVRAARG